MSEQERLRWLRRIWWIRHGESVGNAGARTRDPGSYSLTDRGYAQAEALADAIPRQPGLIIVSPYVRAQQTSEPALQRFPMAQRVTWAVQEIGFLAPEHCVDTTQVERRSMARDYWARCDPGFCGGSGAESFADIISRGQAALQQLATVKDDFVLIFSHGVFMRIVYWIALTRPLRIDAEAMQLCYQFIRSWDVPNCGVLPMLCDTEGALSMGGLCDPANLEQDLPTQERIHLGGL